MNNNKEKEVRERFEEKFRGWILQDKQEFYRSFDVILDFFYYELQRVRNETLIEAGEIVSGMKAVIESDVYSSPDEAESEHDRARVRNNTLSDISSTLLSQVKQDE